MKITKKTGILKIFMVIMLLMTAVFMPSCVFGNSKFESGYFNCEVESFNGGKIVRLLDLTELGKEQEVIVIPETINGYPVSRIGKMDPNIWGETRIWSSSNLKRLYLPFYMGVANNAIDGCSKLEKIVLFNWDVSQGSTVNTVGELAISAGKQCSTVIKYSEFIKEFSNLVVSENVFEKYRITTSNVGYMYNYEKEGGDGYYWIDDYDDEKISYVPADPIREGYTFGGWYKEAECVNKWDFDTDKVHKQEFDDEYYYYQELKLYAKWQ